MKPPLLLLLVILIVWSAPASAQDHDIHHAPKPNFDLAAKFAPYKVRDMLHSTTVNPRWIEGTQNFWYEWKNSDGTFYYWVDSNRGTQRQIFDNDQIAAELTRITRDPWDGQHLPIRNIKFVSATKLQFEVQGSQDEEIEEEVEETDGDTQEEKKTSKPKTRKHVFYFEYDVNSRSLRELSDFEKPDNHPSWASISPDGETILFGRDNNLFKMSREDYDKILAVRLDKTGDDAEKAASKIEVEEIQLTTDGVEHYSFTGSGRSSTTEEVEKNKDKRKRVSVSWSKDSKRFSTNRSDQREVGELWIIHSIGNKRPELETYKYAMPGDEFVGTEIMQIYDLEADSMVTVDGHRFKDETFSTMSARTFRYPADDSPRRSLWLSDNSDDFYFYSISRDLKRVDVMRADAATGEVTVLIEERLNTYVETHRMDILSNGDLLWWSEQNGWGHMYRYAPDGTLKNQVTSGAFSVRGITAIDEDAGRLYFTANAREEGEDPYYNHAYRVNLDGSGLRLLNPGNYDHRSTFNESGKFFVDNYARVNTVPAAALINASGQKVLDLQKADFSQLFEAGYQFPEPFKVKAGDGVTDLYGVMYKPFDFDSTKSYPIVEYVYPGPQTESVSKFFSTNSTETALAQFGMIVVTVGNRGGHPNRSKWYHNYGYGDLRDYGLEDKKVTVEQLANRHPFIDQDRVGIYGHSGGGFMSTAAMLVYPDFFKVAVSSSGNHTNDVYNRWWSEKHHGVKEVVSDSGKVTFEYAIDTNPDLAKNLKGRLLLTTGDEDNNVHPANTYRMVDALIKANKRFDFFLFTGQRHGYGSMSDYWFWLRAEYFVEHLLGSTEWNADMWRLNVEKPKTR
ncbi:MAG: prolyl oligopeptidase family serine peptidase [Bacteroidetes Order II. Incertae sedis bacterium]|nr:prolyl oligopeptidase family serine peptidase [Bacteroidetes Order II. bacterium]